MKHMEQAITGAILPVLVLALFAAVIADPVPAGAFFKNKFQKLTPRDGNLYIPVKDISDGKAHYYKVKSDKGVMVEFFVVKSHDGVIRAAVDACDVCYRSGKGYVQEGSLMVCTNCGMRFASDRINEVKGGCNPAPLDRQVTGKSLVISMNQINANAWLCKYK